MITPVDQLVAVVSNRSRPNRERLQAARGVLWSLEHERAWQGLDLRLARVMISRWLEGVTPARSSDHELVEAWRTEDIAGEALTSELSPTQTLLVAKLLYDRGDHRAAIPYFARVLKAPEIDATTALLAAYNLEHLARQGEGLNEVTAALAILEEGRFASYIDSKSVLAESLHCRGHLLLMVAQMSGRPTGGYSRLGSDLLRQAADLDPSYTSCFTSSFAERGDYVTSISASLDVLRRRPFLALSDEDALIVGLEVLFYLAYCLLCVGEYERARGCLASFIEAVDHLEDDEARDHARLFMVKLELKRKLTSEFTAAELGGYYAELRALAFESPLSGPVAAETRRYERVLEFLIALVNARAALADGRSEPLVAQALSDVFGRARELIMVLVDERPGLLDRAVASVVLASTSAEADSAAWMFKDFERICAVTRCDAATFPATLATSVTRYDTVAVWASEDLAPLVRDHAAVCSRTLILLGVGEPAGTGGVHASSVEEFEQLVIASAALILAKRFLVDDEYIFGLTPCTRSPAVKFQHARYGLNDIRLTEPIAS